MERSQQLTIREQIPPLLFQMMRLMKQQFAAEVAMLPSYLHFETLRFIREEDKPSMREVALYLKVEPPSATALVNSLMEEGLVERLADASDRRIIRLALSKKGEQVFDEVQAKRNALFMNLMSSLSEEDCRDFKRILTSITIVS